MQDDEVLHIEVSKLIHAQKWRIIRLITKVSEFPSFIANVKEACVIQKTHNKMRTKWQVEVDNIPIKWIEEDTLALRENTITLRP